MKKTKESNTEKREIPHKRCWEPPFDSTTNFSLLGWLFDRFEHGPKSLKSVDIKFEE